MLTSRLCFGRADVAALLQTHHGFLDDGADYDIFARSNRSAPAGIGGEAAFYLCYVTVAFDTNTPLAVTILIDDVPQPTKLFNLVAGAERTTTILEVSLLVPSPPAVPNYATRGLWAPRGTWFQVELATVFADAAAYVAIDAVEVEIEIVQEGKKEGVNP